MGMSETIGPIQMGLNKPIHILNVESTVRDILNMVTIAVIDAQVEALKLRQKIELNDIWYPILTVKDWTEIPRI